MELERKAVEEVVARALAEDAYDRDVTSALLVPAGRKVRAEVVAGSAGVLAGMEVAAAVFGKVDETVLFEQIRRDGSLLSAGQVTARVRGAGLSILRAERTALNFLQHLSGIATLTARFVRAVEGTGAVITDTRKTTPGLRLLEKYAVRVGGGRNHRLDLSTMILVKENHLRILGGLEELAKVLQDRELAIPVEVELDSPDLIPALAEIRPERIMLDNLTPSEVKRALVLIGEMRKRDPAFHPEVEVSGGVNPENVAEYALVGVDFISVGALTHSAPALDFSLEVTEVEDDG